MAKSMRVGGGGRFAKLKAKLSHEYGVKDAAAIAASVGRKKYGAVKFAHMAAAGKRHHSHARKFSHPGH